MKIGPHETHEAANLFPMMGEVELKQLADDIKANGQLQPIILHEGKVLDGRNRLKACLQAQVEPQFASWTVEGGNPSMSPTEWVLSTNLRRRHLTQGQAAMIAQDAVALFEEEAAARQRASLKRGSALPVSAPVREREQVETAARGKAAEKAAKSAGVSTRYVETAKAVATKAPELAQKVRTGEMTLKQAEKQIRKAAQVKAIKAYEPPKGVYQVIVADPAWPYDDQLDGSDSARGGLPYPSQTIDEICAQRPPADTDAVLFLWVTNTHLIEGYAAAVLHDWGFTPKTLLTWDKEHMGMGRYLRNQTEHCVVAVKGHPVMTLTNQTTIIREPRREHSRKPEAFYRLVEQVCPSPSRLELNARTSRPGWVTHGVEATKFDEPPKSVPADARHRAKDDELEDCYLCEKPLGVDRADPTQLGLDGKSAHESCLAKAEAKRAESKAAAVDLVDAEIHAHPANAIPCSSCDAPAGEPCLTGSKRLRYPHEPRLRDAAKVTCIGFPRGDCTAKVNPQPTGQNICRKCAIAETNTAKKAARSAAKGAPPTIVWTPTAEGGAKGKGRTGRKYAVTRAKSSRVWIEERGFGEWMWSYDSPTGHAGPFALMEEAQQAAENLEAHEIARKDASRTFSAKAAKKRATERSATSSRDGLCEKQGRDAVQRCQLKDGHRGKCDLKPLKKNAAA